MNLAAVAMSASAKTLGETTGIKVVAPGGKIQSEGTPDGATAAQVQAAIDADPKGFATFATQLVAVADEIAAATTARDAKKTDDAQNRLNDVCMACHVKFWYPNQPK
jgi:cytochrome c556